MTLDLIGICGSFAGSRTSCPVETHIKNTSKNDVFWDQNADQNGVKIASPLFMCSEPLFGSFSECFGASKMGPKRDKNHR